MRSFQVSNDCSGTTVAGLRDLIWWYVLHFKSRIRHVRSSALCRRTRWPGPGQTEHCTVTTCRSECPTNNPPPPFPCPSFFFFEQNLARILFILSVRFSAPNLTYRQACTVHHIPTEISILRRTLVGWVMSKTYGFPFCNLAGPCPASPGSCRRRPRGRCWTGCSGTQGTAGRGR